MRSRLLSLLASLTLAASLFSAGAVLAPAATLALSPGDPCVVPSHNWDGQWAAWPGGSQGLNEAAGYLLQLPDPSNPNDWRNCTGPSGFMYLGASIEQPLYGGQNYIVQVGICKGWCGSYNLDAPTFMYTPTDSTDGTNVTMTLLTPVYGHKYYFQVKNVSHQWQYYILDMNTQASWTTVTSATWYEGKYAWWAGETRNPNDVMGHFTQASNFELYAFHYRNSGQTTGQYDTTSCERHDSNGGHYHCTTYNYGGYAGNYLWTSQ